MQDLNLFQEIILKNKNISAILDAAEKVNLPNWYLSGGALSQTVWNHLCELSIDYGITDYDLIYFDPRREESEKEHELKSTLSDIPIEIVNEAFVHTWLPKYVKHDMEPYTSTEHVLNLTSATVISIGIKKENGDYKLYAPLGVQDVFDMVIRPVKGLFTQEMYETKVEKWKGKWPKLSVIPWNSDII